MALSQRLEFRQSQALVMTPQLMQAIKLLQLSSLDLAAYVEGELERNPLLERGGEDDAPAPGGEPDNSAAGSDGDSGGNNDGDNNTPDWIGADLETSRSSMEQGLGTELENVFPDDGGEKWFCGDCGSALFGRNPSHADPIAIRMGAFDDDPGIRPSVRQFVAYAAPWEPIPDDGLPRHPESRHTR